jgi:N6-adenosine-specific RNA methylase IME4
MRATRRLAEMIAGQKETIGLSVGTRGSRIKGARVDEKPTLAEAGIDKNLAHDARVLGKLSEEKFEQAISDARDAVTRAFKTVVNAAAIAQEREGYIARAAQGGTVTDLAALAASGFRAGVIYVDASWTFHTYSGKGKQRSAERHFDVMTLDAIKALPVAPLAADDCALLLWAVWPELPGALDVIRAWGFQYQTAGFVWVKQNASGDGLFTGMGYHTRANTESCLLATRGSPLRLAADVHQVIMAPVGAHSEKPEEVARRIERLYPAPYLEMFARKPREGWTTWGNEVPR